MNQTPIQKAIDKIWNIDLLKLNDYHKTIVEKELRELLPYEEEFVRRKIKQERDMYKECLEQFIDDDKKDEANLFLSTYGSGLAKSIKDKGL